MRVSLLPRLLQRVAFREPLLANTGLSHYRFDGYSSEESLLLPLAFTIGLPASKLDFVQNSV